MAYFVQDQDSLQLQGEQNEKYAFMHSNEFANIFGQPMKDSNRLGGYLKIANSETRKTIYRKFKAFNLIEGSNVALDYRTRCELGLDANNFQQQVVDIQPTCWCMYYFCNSDEGIKGPAILALIGLILTILSFLLTIIFKFVQ